MLCETEKLSLSLLLTPSLKLFEKASLSDVLVPSLSIELEVSDVPEADDVALLVMWLSLCPSETPCTHGSGATAMPCGAMNPPPDKNGMLVIDEFICAVGVPDMPTLSE